MDLKLKVKLKAYTKAVIPDVSKFIEDAPKDNKVYGRKDGDWVNIDSSLVKTRILPRDNNSGLDIEPVGGIVRSCEFLSPYFLTNSFTSSLTLFMKNFDLNIASSLYFS